MHAVEIAALLVAGRVEPRDVGARQRQRREVHADLARHGSSPASQDALLVNFWRETTGISRGAAPARFVCYTFPARTRALQPEQAAQLMTFSYDEVSYTPNAKLQRVAQLDPWDLPDSYRSNTKKEERMLE